MLSDVWGVIHNGVAATPEACDALMRFRAKGGTVMLITNAPRPGAVVTKFLDKLSVPRDAYDGIVSSGDVARAVMGERPGKNVFHIGPRARPADLRRARPELRAVRTGGLCGLHRPGRRRSRDAGKLSRSC